ncbi:MAG: DUF177 domain-containing protein [Dehalococcoidia bacterium]|nr:DUF177 domain-containing protein [Dehalococcoidia bacterium]
MESLSGNPLDIRLNVSALLQQPVGTNMLCRIEDMLSGAQQPLVTGTITLTHTSRGITVSGSGTSDVMLTCIRCLDEYSERVHFVIEEELHPEPGFAHRRGADGFEECGEVRIQPDHTLDLGEIIRQYIVLHLPLKPLCRTDCPGLEEKRPDV